MKSGNEMDNTSFESGNVAPPVCLEEQVDQIDLLSTMDRFNYKKYNILKC